MAGSLLFIKDTVNKRLQNLSCSSAAAAAVLPQPRRRARASSKAATASGKHHSGAGGSNKKEEEARRLQVSPASSSRFLLSSSRLHLHANELIDVFPPPLHTDEAPAGSVPSSSSTDEIAAVVEEERISSGDGEEKRKAAIMMRSFSCSTKTELQAQAQVVVVLRVSLHCKGCAGKVKKHISRMEGVTSFDIDVATKKVTVVGDVTPLAVLSAISKIKPAQFWPASNSPAPARASASF